MSTSPIQTVIEQSVLVNPFVRSVGGTMKLVPADLGLRDDEVPPSELAKLGSFCTLPKEALRPFEAARAAMVTACLKFGTRRFGAYLVARHRAEELALELSAIVAEVYKAKDAFILTREAIVNEWLDREEHRKFAPRIRSRLRPTAYFSQRIQAGFQMAQIGPVTTSSDLGPGLSEAVRRTEDEFAGAFDSVLQEIAQEAGELFRVSLHERVPDDAPAGFAAPRRKSVTQKILSPLRRWHQKMSDLGFLSPVVARAANWLAVRMSVLPSEGRMEGAELDHIYETVSLLMDPVSLVQAVDATHSFLPAPTQPALELQPSDAPAASPVSDIEASPVQQSREASAIAGTLTLEPSEEDEFTQPEVVSSLVPQVASTVVPTVRPTSDPVPAEVYQQPQDVVFDYL